MQWGDSALSCPELKARYDQLGPLVKDAGRLLPLPDAPDEPIEPTRPITFLPLFGPLIAMGMDSAAREQAASEAAQTHLAIEFQTATIAHQRGHEAMDRRQDLVYLASQKGCN